MVMQQIVIMVNAITIVAPLVTVLLTSVANYDHYRNCNYTLTLTDRLCSKPYRSGSGP